VQHEKRGKSLAEKMILNWLATNSDIWRQQLGSALTLSIKMLFIKNGGRWSKLLDHLTVRLTQTNV